MAPRFFVDSKEGFRIEQVRESVLPIVTDDAHRSRIRQAQGRYVLATAAEALSVLLDYISTRSNNLNRLRTEAQQRADGDRDGGGRAPRVSGTLLRVRSTEVAGVASGHTYGELRGRRRS